MARIKATQRQTTETRKFQRITKAQTMTVRGSNLEGDLGGKTRCFRRSRSTLLAGTGIDANPFKVGSLLCLSESCGFFVQHPVAVFSTSTCSSLVQQIYIGLICMVETDCASGTSASSFFSRLLHAVLRTQLASNGLFFLRRMQRVPSVIHRLSRTLARSRANDKFGLGTETRVFGRRGAPQTERKPADSASAPSCQSSLSSAFGEKGTNGMRQPAPVIHDALGTVAGSS